MFKFGFELDVEEDGAQDPLQLGIDELHLNENNQQQNAAQYLERSTEVPLPNLLNALPALISYSPVSVPLTASKRSLPFPRRDLFDARFQLISEGGGDNADVDQANSVPEIENMKKKALEFIDAPSDLVRGVYEGGLKTWECSLDLVDYLNGSQSTADFWGRNILELGCGTAMPSTYILHALCHSFSDRKDAKRTEIHMQDYNISVLQLVTLPNLVLCWYSSPAANLYRATIGDPEIAPLLDPTTSGELPVTPDLKDSFLAFLTEHSISLRFFAGSWETYDPTMNLAPPQFDLVLSSETIYQTDTQEVLLDVVEKAVNFRQEKLPSPLCLIAAKVLYFGVGGDISDFLKLCKKRGLSTEAVLERNAGVGRKVISLRWTV